MPPFPGEVENTPPLYLTADIPGAGGVIKQRPEDFFVEELPAYEPSGQGEHIYLFIEKRNISTMHAMQAIARHFGVRVQSVGFAGLKDKAAVTRQLVSVHVPGRATESFPAFQHDRVGVLWVDRHANKLRQGHLAGNRFIIRIRGIDAGKALHAHRVLQRLAVEGVPNRIGEQRFGNLRNNHVVGRLLLLKDHQGALDELLGPSRRFPDFQREYRDLYAQGRYDEAWRTAPRNADTERRVLRALAQGVHPHRAIYHMGHMPLRFFITAFQSAVFNTVLDDRLRAGLLGSLRAGDLAFKHDSGAVFRVDDPVLADPSTRERLASLAISPSGPMWGAEMMQPEGESRAVELAALAATGVTLDDLRAFAAKTRDAIEGRRRPLRVPLRFPEVEGGADEHGPYVKCSFELPAGSFATEVMREVIKPAAEPPEFADDPEQDERA